MTTPPFPDPSIRIGHGYDLHRLEPIGPSSPARPLVLGGVHLDHTHGPVSHSDGDALLHAITDAILGALCLQDIGQLFPDHAPENLGRDSADFLREALSHLVGRGWAVGNIDATVVLERPKLSEHKTAMRTRIAEILGIELSAINIKGKTHEKVDAVGEGRAVEVHAVVLIHRSEQP